jgi:CheY-like chemotaxis protein
MALVLNVDDRPSSLRARERLLTRGGYTVVNATTGKDAIAMAERLHPDVILLDVHLPDIDGREVCRRLKADPDLQHTPVVLASTTTRGDAAQLEMIHWAGADAFLVKPFEEATLTSTLHAVLGPGGRS